MNTRQIGRLVRLLENIVSDMDQDGGCCEGREIKI
jgi:hypothetical protein